METCQLGGTGGSGATGALVPRIPLDSPQCRNSNSYRRQTFSEHMKSANRFSFSNTRKKTSKLVIDQQSSCGNFLFVSAAQSDPLVPSAVVEENRTRGMRCENQLCAFWLISFSRHCTRHWKNHLQRTTDCGSTDSSENTLQRTAVCDVGPIPHRAPEKACARRWIQGSSL